MKKNIFIKTVKIILYGLFPLLLMVIVDYFGGALQTGNYFLSIVMLICLIYFGILLAPFMFLAYLLPDNIKELFINEGQRYVPPFPTTLLFIISIIIYFMIIYKILLFRDNKKLAIK